MAEDDEFQDDQSDDADRPDGGGEEPPPGEGGGVASAYFARDAAQWAEQIREQFSPLFETVQRQLAQQRPIFAEIARTIGDQQSQLFRFRLPKIELPDVSLFAELGKRWREALPDNWRELPAGDFERLTAVARMTGWSLAWAPRQEVLSELLHATDVVTAENLLTEHSAEVLADLKGALAEVDASTLIEQREALLQGIAAFDAGIPHPAQAIAAAVITTLIEQQLDQTLSAARKDWEGLDPEEQPILSYRRSLVLLSLASSLQNYTDEVPSRFNRHATAHRFDLGQYRDANALAGLMLATALLREVQEDLNRYREAPLPA